ncbi:MAG: adenylyltransferase/sulfurtransferase MoeZ [Mycobacterium sp.]|nr:adenylyltransferase/sulfurtransferase MoeZ [Mycobacterium sp.]
MPLPPLVEPGSELTKAEVARYSRHLILPEFGVLGQRRLKNARVLVIGAGGLGSPTLLYLAAAGVGTLGIVDFDTVEESNLQRQIIHGCSDVGRPKAQSARDAIAELNPLVTVRLHEVRLEPENALELFEQYDLIVDGTDNFATRYLVNDAAVLTHKPYVWGSIYRFEGQVSVFWEDAPDGPDGERRGINYRDLFPEPPPPGLVPSCAEGGVLGVLCAAIASVMSTEAIKLITATGDPLLGRVLLYDALAMNYRTIGIRKDPAAPAIVELADYEQLCGGSGPDIGSGITPQALRDLLDAEAGIVLIDVREPAEWQINRIDGAHLIPLSAIASGAGLDQLPADRVPVLYCKSGIRSAEALAVLHRAGFANALHLEGGILAWAEQFEPDMAMY